MYTNVSRKWGGLMVITELHSRPSGPGTSPGHGIVYLLSQKVPLSAEGNRAESGYQ